MSEIIIAPLVAGFASSPDNTGDRRFHRRGGGGNEREHALLHVTARLRPLMEWWFMWLHRPAGKFGRFARYRHTAFIHTKRRLPITEKQCADKTPTIYVPRGQGNKVRRSKYNGVVRVRQVTERMRSKKN
jgi:hypothetical protein